MRVEREGYIMCLCVLYRLECIEKVFSLSALLQVIILLIV